MNLYFVSLDAGQYIGGGGALVWAADEAGARALFPESGAWTFSEGPSVAAVTLVDMKPPAEATLVDQCWVSD